MRWPLTKAMSWERRIRIDDNGYGFQTQREGAVLGKSLTRPMAKIPKMPLAQPFKQKGTNEQTNKKKMKAKLEILYDV